MFPFGMEVVSKAGDDAGECPAADGIKAFGHLELREDEDHAAYWLDGKVMENGEGLELQLADGTWLRGAFEWRGIKVVWPALRIWLAGRVSRCSQRRNSSAIPLPPTARVRRPWSAATNVDEESSARGG